MNQKSLSKKLTKLTDKNIVSYQKHLVEELKLSPATVKRRLSSIRKFSDWAFQQGYLEKNPFLKETEIPGKFIPQKLTPKANVFQKAYQTYSQFSVTKYFHYAILIIFCAAIGFGAYDQFFKKTPTPLAYPESLTAPNRFLSFQGRLTDSSDNPISGYTDITFKLWKTSSGGTEGTCTGDTGEDCLWTSGTCSVNSDQDGIFSLLLGTTSGPEYTCSAAIEIPADVFTENTDIWLAITVDDDGEMDPRMQVATVGYALNAETLQGYPPGTEASMIPYIDSTGKVVLAAASPTIQATSGTFALEGQTGITIQVADGQDGNITLSPKGTGTVNLTSEATTGNLLNNQGGANFGTEGGKEDNNLYYGYVGLDTTNFNLLKLEAGETPSAKFTVDASGNASLSGQLRLGNFDSDPTAVGKGAMIYKTSDDKLYYWNGSSWTEVGSGSGGGDSWWTEALGLLYPVNETLDLAIGGTSTASANVKFGASSDSDSFIYGGSLGIGIRDPSYKLHIKSDGTSSYPLVVSASDGSTLLDLYESGAGNGIMEIKNEAGAANIYLSSSNNSYFNGGNVGIGDTSPAYLFTVGSGDLFGVNSSGYALLPNGSASTPALAFTSDTNTGLYRIGTDKIGLITGGSATQGLTIDASGNVGIGTTDPGAELDVVGNILLQEEGSIDTRAAGALTIGGTTQTGLTLGRSGQSTTLAGNVQAFTLAGNITGSGTPDITGIGGFSGSTAALSSTGDALTLSGAGANINFSGVGLAQILTAASQDLALMPGGSVGIGTTTPGQKLDVQGNITTSTGNYYSQITDSSTAVAFTFDTDNSLTTQGAKLLSLKNNTTEKFYVDKDGNLYAAGTILSGNGQGMLITNKSGGTVTNRSLVVLDTTTNSSFTTTTTPYSKTSFGVVTGVGLGITNDADEDGVCDADDNCMVAVGGEVEVTTTNASSASRGDYLYTSTTAGSAVASAKQFDGLIGVVSNIAGAASGYVKMIFKVQPQVSGSAFIAKEEEVANGDYLEIVHNANSTDIVANGWLSKEGIWKDISTATESGIISNTDASVANGDYVEVAHNQETNDINATGWVYNTDTSKWEQTDNLGEGSTSNIDLMEYSSNALAQAAYVNDNIDSYTKLLLHANGTDGSTTFTDSESTPKTMTAVGNAQIDTAQSKFGGASGLFDGAGDYLSTPDHADWDLGTGDWTIDFWIRRNGNLTDYAGILSTMDNYTALNGWQIGHYMSNRLRICGDVSGSWPSQITMNSAVPDATWTHIAFVRNGNTVYMYMNGVADGSASVTGWNFADTSAGAVVGRPGISEANYYFSGWLDELRVSKGIARWTSAFTPPAAPYPLELQDYSESTIKQEGSYSLKGVAVITDSLNDTLTRTVSPVIDLTDQKTIKFDVRSSRTGTNLQAQIHDSGGTTSTHDINIASADTWQTEVWDISGVSTGDKNAVDQIIFKVTNADAENTFYIDNMYSSSGDYLIVQQDANTARLYNYSGSTQNLRLDVSTQAYQIRNIDANTTRLYNFSGSTQTLKLAIIPPGGGGSPGAGAGLFTNSNASVADGSYVEVAHNQNTSDLVSNGWRYNTSTSKWEQTDNLGEGSTSNIDLMEYSSNALAQTAYVSSDPMVYGATDRLTGGTATANNENLPASNAVDNNLGTKWYSAVGPPSWWEYDCGAGNTWAFGKLRAANYSSYGMNAFNVQGSNNDSDWTTLYSGNMPNDTAWHEFTWFNTTEYRYIKINITSQYYSGALMLAEFEAMEGEPHLQDYSESTIKQEGSYSLKGVAVITDSLNDTLTRTVSPVLDLTDQNTIKFDVRSSRTGTNLQAQIHDSGGTTSTHDINIASADTWQTETWDISGVSNGDKNAIDQIVFKVTNADAENTFYIDNMYSSSGDYLIVQYNANTARLYNYSGSTQNLRLDVITGGLGRNSGTVSLAPLAADVDSQDNLNSIWINKTGSGGNLLKLQASGSDKLVLASTGTLTLTGDFLPGTDDTYDLGSSSARWQDLYLGPTSLHLVSTVGETTTARDWKFGIQETAGSSQGNLRILEGDNELVNITPEGNVGIGTTDPEVYKLYVAGNVSFNSGGIYSDDDNYFHASRLVDTANDDFFVDPAATGTSATFFGNVGIGTTSPSYGLDVKARSTVEEKTFTGSGLDDMTPGGTFIGITALNYKVEIDAADIPDTFKWSDDGGVTWDATGVAITGAAQTLNYGVTVTFGATTGHTLGDYWTFPTTVTNPLAIQDATGTISLYVGNDGNVGIGTTNPQGILNVAYTGLDSYTKLLLHADGTDGSTTFTDSATGKAVTAVGTAQIDTAQSKFDGASLLLNGSSDYLTLLDNTDWAFGTGDFTIDFWVRLAALPGAGVDHVIMAQYQDASNWTKLTLYNNGTAYFWSLYVRAGAVNTITYQINPASIVAVNTWYHVALVRNGTSFKWYQNGVALGAGITDADPLGDITSPLFIGYIGAGTYLNGWIDEFRISKGIARWTENFTPPTSAYSPALTNSGFVIASTGKVGIGTVTPDSKMQVTGGGLCVGSDANCNSDNNTEGVVYSSSTAMTTYDVAENYPTKDETLKAGEVVSVDEENEVFVERSTSAYSQNLLGVISTEPGVLLGGFAAKDYLNETKVPVALSGRVPVYIATNSAEIKVGDLLTSSDEPGKAMKAEKAGATIGKALESWSPDSGKEKIMVFVNLSWHDPDVYLTSIGNLVITQEASQSGSHDEEATGSTLLAKYNLKDSLGEIIQRIGTFSEAVIANLRAGRIETEELISPLIKSEEIQTERLSLSELTPLADQDIIINLQQNITGDQEASESSSNSFGKLIIKGREGQEVVSIDAEGNASFSGELTTESLLVEENATITGTLYADEIITRHGKFGDLLVNEIAKTETPIESMDESLINEVADSAILSEEEINNLINEILASASPEATSQAVLAENINIPNDLLVSNSLNIGGTLSLADNAANTLSGPLYLQSLGLGGIDFLAGKIVIDEHGNATFEGDVTIKGKLATQSINPLPENDLVIDLAQIPITNESETDLSNEATQSAFGNLLVKGFEGKTVASIDASGLAKFASLGIEADYSATQSGTIIAAADNYQENGEYSPAIKTNATAGIGLLPANESEIMVYNSKITDQSLIYITPLTNTSNKVIYVKAKKAEGDIRWFKVAIDTPINQEIKFNWWIVN